MPCDINITILKNYYILTLKLSQHLRLKAKNEKLSANDDFNERTTQPVRPVSCMMCDV
jgi:hypothetical protein